MTMMTINKDHIIENLREVYDPEMLSLNIYDLGLIYDININEVSKILIKSINESI